MAPPVSDRNALTDSGFVARLAAGYRKLFNGGVRLAAATLFLLFVSALISIPVWFFAHAAPEAFDFVVIAAITGGIGWTIFRRVRSGEKKWTLRRFAVSGFTIALPMIILLLAIVGRNGVLALAGALLLSGVIAWRVVPS